MGYTAGFRVANGRDELDMVRVGLEGGWVLDNVATIVAWVFEAELSSDVAEVAAVCREGSVKR